jgi:hypothetical protein
MSMCSFQRGNALIPWEVRSLSRNETTRESGRHVQHASHAHEHMDKDPRFGATKLRL